MQKLIDVLKIALYLASIVFVFALVHLTVTVSRDVHQVAGSVRDLGEAIGTSVFDVHAALLDKKDGLPAIEHEVHAGARAVRTLTDDIRKTTLEERSNVKQATDQFVSLITHTDAAVTHIDSSTTEAFQSIPALSQQAQFTFGAVQRDMDSITDRVRDPKIDELLTNVAVVTHNAAESSSDAYVWMHGTLFPVKKHGWARLRSDAAGVGKAGWLACRISGYCPSF